MRTYTFAWKTTLVHTVTYFIVGLLSLLLLDYSTNYADPVVSVSLREDEGISLLGDQV